MNLRLATNQALFWALFFFGLQFYAPDISILLSCLLAAIIIWKADPRYLHVLFVLFLRPANFLLTYYGLDFFSQGVFGANGFEIGGFSLNVPLVCAIVAGLRVIYDYFFKVKSILSSCRVILFLWLSAFIPSLICCYLGLVKGNNGWSEPIRYLLIAGTYFYGIILGQKWPRSFDLIYKKLSVFILLLSILSVFALFHHRLLWYFAAFVPALFYCHRKTKNKKERFIFLLSYIFIGLFCTGISVSEKDTFTLIGLFLISTILGILAFEEKGFLKNVISRYLGLPALIVSILFVVLVVNIKDDYMLGSIRRTNNLTIEERLQGKIFNDRARVWGANIKYILAPPYLFKPGGDSIVLEHPTLGYIKVTFGAHNTFLQSIRTNGWYSGIIIIIILCVAVIKNVLVYRRSHIGEIKAIAIATIATGVFGAMTGHYVLGLAAGFWIMTLAGAAYSVFLIYEQC